MATVLKADNFELVTEFAQMDTKRRLSLGSAASDARAYNIYRNAVGQLILDPVRTIPLSETWLYDNPDRLASVKQGLRDSGEGRTVDRGSFAAFAHDELP